MRILYMSTSCLYSLPSQLASHDLPLRTLYVRDREAEEMVMRTVDPSAFTVAVVEATGAHPDKDERVDAMFTRASMQSWSRMFGIFWNRVYAAPGVPMHALYARLGSS